MRLSRASIFWLIGPASLALWLILVTPTRWLGIESGVAGSALLLLVAWTGLWISSRAPANPESAIAPAEVRSWVALIFTAAIAAFLLLKFDVIAQAQTVADLRGVGRTVVMLIIGWTIFSSILRHRAQTWVQEDERDRVVQASADSWSHGALSVAVICIAVALGLSPAERLDWATPIVVAHVLIFALVAANLVGCVTAVLLYRRDRL